MNWEELSTEQHGLSLATITGRWLGETSFVQVSTTWALPELVHPRPPLIYRFDTVAVCHLILTTDMIHIKHIL